MSAADLTRGGFYAHFDSKDSLIEAILTRDAGLVKMLRDRVEDLEEGTETDLLKILQDYLNPDNLDEIIEGCPLATMPVDAARAAPNIKAAYGNRLSALVNQLEKGFDDKIEDTDDAIAIAILAVGGVLFARASASNEDGEKIQAACIRQIEKLVSD